MILNKKEFIEVLSSRDAEEVIVNIIKKHRDKFEVGNKPPEMINFPRHEDEPECP